MDIYFNSHGTLVQFQLFYEYNLYIFLKTTVEESFTYKQMIGG